MIGDIYTHEKWESFADWLLDNLNPDGHDAENATSCPLCGDVWGIERGEDLCWCQFFKRERI
jgi:hypothetical protein